MRLHRNAALSWIGRRQLAERVAVEGWMELEFDFPRLDGHSGRKPAEAIGGLRPLWPRKLHERVHAHRTFESEQST